MRLAAIASVVLLIGSSLVCSGSETEAGDNRSATEETSPQFTRTNWSELQSRPGSHKGATVEIVGEVFTDPKREDRIVSWQMHADPRNGEWNTIVGIEDSSLAIKNGDYVRIKGEVLGAAEGRNAFGATLVIPQIQAHSVEIVSPIDAASNARRTVEINETQDQHGVVIAIDKIEFADDETRLFMSVRNDSQETASFYSSDAKAVQGETQYDAQFSSDYGDIKSELLSGTESSGVLVFEAMNTEVETRIFLEARNEDYSLDFEPFVFTVSGDSL